MNYASIKYCDIANGAGCRTSLFVSGCTHHCKDCFNEVAWDFNYGEPFNREVENEILESLNHNYIAGLTLLGGEPMEVVNQRGLIGLIRSMKSRFPEKDIWVYSGYTWEELTDKSNQRCHCEVTDEILRSIDILVDGKFDYLKKDITLKFRGSSNQRIIDVPATLKAGQIVRSKHERKEYV